MIRAAIWGCCGLLLLCAAGFAQSTTPSTNQTRPADDFVRGTWSVTLNGAYAHSFITSPARIETGSIGVGYYVLDHASLNLEAAGFGLQQPGKDAIVSDLDILLRHHVWVQDRFSLFLDVGGGLTYSTHAIPNYATWFNFLAEAGIGATWRLRDNMYLFGGGRWLHFSNAALEGPDRNPSINALEGYLGVMFTF